MAAQDRFVAGGDDGVRELRREKPAQLLQPTQLVELRLHTLLERPVQVEQLCGLSLDRVVVALDPEERADAREELVAVERLRDEVVRAGLDRSPLLGSFARREHDHRQNCGLLPRTQLPADGVAVEPGHHHVEQHEVRGSRESELEGAVAVHRRDDVVAVRLEHGLEESHVLGNVVDDEDSGVVAHGPPPSQ